MTLENTGAPSLLGGAQLIEMVKLGLDVSVGSLRQARKYVLFFLSLSLLFATLFFEKKNIMQMETLRYSPYEYMHTNLKINPENYKSRKLRDPNKPTAKNSCGRGPILNLRFVRETRHVEIKKSLT